MGYYVKSGDSVLSPRKDPPRINTKGLANARTLADIEAATEIPAVSNDRRKDRHMFRSWILRPVLDRLDQIMATIQEILDDENTETADLAQLVTVVGSLNQNVVDLQALVAELQAAQGLTPEQQAQLDAINAAQAANDATIRSLLPPTP